MLKYTIIYRIKKAKNQGAYILVNADTGEKILMKMDDFITAIQKEQMYCLNGKIIYNRLDRFPYILTDGTVKDISWSYFNKWQNEIMSSTDDVIKT